MEPVLWLQAELEFGRFSVDDPKDGLENYSREGQFEQ